MYGNARWIFEGRKKWIESLVLGVIVVQVGTKNFEIAGFNYP